MVEFAGSRADKEAEFSAANDKQIQYLKNDLETAQKGLAQFKNRDIVKDKGCL